MPTAVTDKKGSEIYYTDTGAVPGSDNYLTLFIYHGTAFNGGTFAKLPALGASRNVRIVIPNRRNYRGSTKFTQEDLDNLYQGRKEFLHTKATDVANFLTWFVDNNDLPKTSPDGKTGGIALSAWSMGTATLSAFFGQPDVVGKETYDKLAPYLRSFIIYDSPIHTFGWPLPTEIYSPFGGTTDEEKLEGVKKFVPWVSSYYQHGDLNSGKMEDLDRTSEMGTDPTLARMKPEEIGPQIDQESGKDDIGSAAIPDSLRAELQEQTRKALFDEESAQTILPKVKVGQIVCRNTPAPTAWGYMEVRRTYQELAASGKKLRPTRFLILDNANHFAHWDSPERLLDAFVDLTVN